MSTPKRILDLFCGAGGAGAGYHEVWPDAEIVGVDLNPQPRYPFTFVQADAMTFDLSGFDFIHASPPCQAYTTMGNRYRGAGGAADSHPDYIAAVRERILAAGGPYVIENVLGARKLLRSPVMLSGGMFGLGVRRDRLFECSFPVTAPKAQRVANPVAVYGKLDGRRIWTRKDGSEIRCARTLQEGRDAMGISWMEWRELAESIPPAYTAHIARQLPTR